MDGQELGGLTEELRHVERCRAGLNRMLDAARHNVIVGETVAGDRYSAERLGRHLKSLAKELSEEPEGPPFFGRLTFGPAGSAAASAEHAGRTYYIGRRHIPGEHGGAPVVIDWRAPVARSFYRAGARDPQGVAVRRRFGWAGTTLTSYEDERLGRGEERRSRLLAAEIERPRVGPMRDIVATIQPEQDDLVRAGLDDSIAVQGAPGTGKTAVGLHRAAYLLYAHRQRLQRGGVLVLGPNRAFLGYIAAVLPALGEVDVEQTTLDGLIASVPVRAEDGERAAAVKHDARMAGVLRRALYGRIAKPAEPVTVAEGSYRWRVDEDELRRIVDDTRRDALPYGIGRERVRARVVALMRRQAEARGHSTNAAWERRTGRALGPWLDGIWPAVRAEQVVHEVLSGRWTAAGGKSVLSDAEWADVVWERPARTYKSVKWSAADLVLIDEVAGMLERPRGYGHVIVDEAQDLSPMQCRAVARRAEHGSLTVLGDLAQGTTPWAARSWPELMAALGRPEARVVELTTGYRVPAAVVELANRLLSALDAGVPATRSYRSDGLLRVTRVPGVEQGVVAAARGALELEGSVGVIAADADAERLKAALWDAGLDVGGRLSVVPVTLVKGLEYDHVVLAEPAAIAEAEERGLNRLYVALTRAVSRLDVVHARPLPPELEGPGEGSSGAPEEGACESFSTAGSA
ncbi:HelD family protein [Nonomuraea rhodomycinica]|uniref:ATP-binding domain-containing protein n=1 Tax=Nonomuraea rhodomycinica TaxID=1712872 RepID=A0A7Y6IJD0_9ACTN|nr:ATP-binding domain-containing protein [Nonomuraea rhodomycinica]NUW38783.1 ATP-binding domain-containing protein [Nonomuraea rhodomycinica]